MNSDESFMDAALKLAIKARGMTSPNPMVGAVLVRSGRVIGQGWHRQAGRPHAEIEALADAVRRGHRTQGSELFVTLEPCSTHGRTPPCTDAILAGGIRRVVIGAVDPNPKHAGRGTVLLQSAGLEVLAGIRREACERLIESFGFWIVQKRPWVVVKAAMTLDGKIATSSGESKWITSEASRRDAMKLRMSSDAIVAGVRTIELDDPSLTVRRGQMPVAGKKWKRVILDTRARVPLKSRVVSDDPLNQTIVVVGRGAPAKRCRLLERQVEVWEAPLKDGRIDLRWLLGRLGALGITQLLVEGGGEVQAGFFQRRLVNRIVFYYAPRILGGFNSLRAVAGVGATSRRELIGLSQTEWSRTGPDLRLTALVARGSAQAK